MAETLRYTDGMDYLETAEYDGWEFTHSTWRDGEVQTLGAENPEIDAFERVSQGNPVWQTRTICSKSGMRLKETRKGIISEIRECRENEYVALVDFGTELARADAREILVSESTELGEWQLECPDKMDFDQKTLEQWVDITEQAEIPEIESTDALSFEKIDGRGSQITVNEFLEGSSDDTVHHSCGGVHHWKAAFVARYQGEIVGAIVLAPHQNGQISSAKEEIVISRIACHPSRPKNTSTWLISRARKWAERAGYSRISALSGVGGNRGQCYQAAGFTLEDENPSYQDGNGDIWHKRRYVSHLEPEKYEGRDVPLPGVDYGMEPASA